MYPTLLHELMKAHFATNKSKRTEEVKLKTLRSQAMGPVRTKTKTVEHRARHAARAEDEGADGLRYISVAMTLHKQMR